MTRRTSLGDLITALYDAAESEAADADPRTADSLVAVCTLDLLLRQRRSRALVELLAELPN